VRWWGVSGDKALLGLTGLASIASAYAMLTMQLQPLVETFQNLAKQIFILGIWIGVLFIVSGLVVRYIPDISAASPKLIRGGAYLLVGLAVLNLLFSAFGISLMSVAPSGTVIQYLVSAMTPSIYASQLLYIIIIIPLFLGVFMISFGPGFLVGYFGNIPLMHKYHLIVLGIMLLVCMAFFDITLGFIIWLFLAPYYLFGACVAYMVRQGAGLA
jgi:hypothetical protein